MKKHITFLLTFVVIAVIIGLLNWYSTPTMLEDLLYRYVWQPEWEQPGERIGSLADVVRSQQIHYWSNGGRVVVHSVAQVLLNLVPERLSQLLNTAMFLLMTVLVAKMVSKTKELRTVVVALSFAMLFLLIQGFYMGFIWLIGANNYLWPMVANMAFILGLTQETAPTTPTYKDNIRWFRLLLMLLLSLVAGWTHEALTVPVSMALLYWLFRHRKGMLRHPTTYYIMAYLAGVMMLLLSPALWHRADENGIGLQQRLVYGMFNLVLNVRITWLLLATLAVQLYRGKDVLAASLRANRYILTAWVAAVGIVIVCGENLVRVAIYADFLAMLAVLKIWQGEWLRRHQTAVVTLCMVACVTIAIPAIALNMENRENYLYHCQQFEEPGKQVIKIRQTFNGSNMADQWLRKRYVLPNIEFGFALYNMPFDSHDYDTRAVAWLFNKDDIVMLPEDVVDKIEADSNAYVQWEADSNETLYIWQLQPPRKVSRVVFELGDEIALPFYMRWTTYPGHEYELDSMKHEVVTLRDNSYLVMTIPMNKIKRRIKAIRIEP